MYLTKSADKTLCLIYKKYLTKVKSGISKQEANHFNTFNIENDFKNVNSDDFDNDLDELCKIKFINFDIVGNYSLTTSGIIYLENRFKNGLNEVTDFIAKFIP